MREIRARARRTSQTVDQLDSSRSLPVGHPFATTECELGPPKESDCPVPSQVVDLSRRKHTKVSTDRITNRSTVDAEKILKLYGADMSIGEIAHGRHQPPSIRTSIWSTFSPSFIKDGRIMTRCGRRRGRSGLGQRRHECAIQGNADVRSHQ